MPDYTVSLNKFGITKDEFQEMDAFCRQYGRKKRLLGQMLNQQGRALDGMPHERRDGDPTLRIVMRRERLMLDCRMIEESVQRAAPDFYRPMLLNVTRRIPYDALHPPCGRRKFLQARRLFYLYLYALRNE